MPIFIKRNKLKFDIVHNLNFHTDWLPSFLWVFNKPFIWGPVGHHPCVPNEFSLNPYGRKEVIKNKATWFLKKLFWTFDIFLKICRNSADYILAVNSDTRKHLSSDKNKTIVIPAVAAPKYVFEKKKDEIFTVLSVGRFVPLKGFDLTVACFAKFIKGLPLEKRKNAKLFLIGSGPLKTFLQNQIKELQIEEYVEMIPWIEQNKLFDIYTLADVFLFPSHEGAGMVIPEALSFELPVICFDNSGPGELVSKLSELKVPYTTYDNSVNQFAGKLNLLFTNNALFQKEKELAREHHAAYLTWESKGIFLDTLYNTLDRKFYEEGLCSTPAERLQREPVGF
ncbi:MAG: glycosyltransferase family 4 protein [Chitinophagales bacterium]